MYFENFLRLVSKCVFLWVFWLNTNGNSAGHHCVLCVDCCSTIIAFAQYIQEASFEEVEMLVKAMKEYRDRCLADMTLPECSKLAVSKLFACLKQTSLFLNTERVFDLEIYIKKRDALCLSFSLHLISIFRIRHFCRWDATLYSYVQEDLAMTSQSVP